MDSGLLSKLNQGRKDAPIPADLQVILARLKTGQLWLVEKGIALHQTQTYDGEAETQFLKSYHEWDRLERETRKPWAYVGCVIGPGGCHKDAPLWCDFCLGRVETDVPVAPENEPVAETGNQGALFETGGKSHYG